MLYHILRRITLAKFDVHSYNYGIRHGLLIWHNLKETSLTHYFYYLLNDINCLEVLTIPAPTWSDMFQALWLDILVVYEDWTLTPVATFTNMV